jgi:hypothetical protein
VAVDIVCGRPKKHLIPGAAILPPHSSERNDFAAPKNEIGKMEGDPMKIKSPKMVNKTILIVVVLGFALTILTGCGIGHGSYRHGYDGQNYHQSGYGHPNNSSGAAEYDNAGRGYGRFMTGYGNNRSAYCGW